MDEILLLKTLIEGPIDAHVHPAVGVWHKLATPPRTARISGLKMMVKSGLDFFFFFFKIEQAPSEIPARPMQPFWVDFFSTGQQHFSVGMQDGCKS